MFLYDTHVHTKEISPCGQATAARQVRVAKECGYTGLIITDHLVENYSRCPDNLPWEERAAFQLTSYQLAKKEGDRIGVDVFFGWEYTHWHLIPGADILTYGLGLDFLLAHPKLFTYTLEEYSRAVRGAGGYLAHAHPFRSGHNRALDIEGFSPDLFDGVEVYNSSETKDTNDSAMAYAKKYGLLMQSGSDSHTASKPRSGGVWLEKRAESIFDIINGIKCGAKGYYR